MEYANFFGAQGVQAVGTSYYCSGLHYLGYTPYDTGDDVKPNIFWVSG